MAKQVVQQDIHNYTQAMNYEAPKEKRSTGTSKMVYGIKIRSYDALGARMSIWHL